MDDLKSGVVEVEFLEQHEVTLLPEDHFGVLLDWGNNEESVVVLRLDLLDLLCWGFYLLLLGLLDLLDMLLLLRHHNSLNMLRRDITGSPLVIEHNSIGRRAAWSILNNDLLHHIVGPWQPRIAISIRKDKRSITRFHSSLSCCRLGDPDTAYLISLSLGIVGLSG